MTIKMNTPDYHYAETGATELNILNQASNAGAIRQCIRDSKMLDWLINSPVELCKHNDHFAIDFTNKKCIKLNWFENPREAIFAAMREENKI